MKDARLLKQLGLQCAGPDCIAPATDVVPISISNDPKKTLPVCDEHADAAIEDLWKARKTKVMTGTIRIKMDDKEIVVPRSAYVKAKAEQMRQFGYPSVTEDGINEQIEALIAKKKFGEGLTVIGMFIQDEIILPTT